MAPHSYKSEELLHGNALRLGKFGILIIGASSSGKSLITLSLIERAQFKKQSAAFIADDYVELQVRNNALIARAPQTIQGAIEIRGAGLFHIDFQPEVRLDIVVSLGNEAERYPVSNNTFSLNGITLPQLDLPTTKQVESIAICHAIEATLFKRVWNKAVKN